MQNFHGWITHSFIHSKMKFNQWKKDIGEFRNFSKIFFSQKFLMPSTTTILSFVPGILKSGSLCDAILGGIARHFWNISGENHRKPFSEENFLELLDGVYFRMILEELLKKSLDELQAKFLEELLGKFIFGLLEKCLTVNMEDH